MADQDWGNADGTAEGPGGGSMAGGERGRVAGADALNVVPFPRDWFGSVDDLVPIDLEPPQPGPDAAAFWDGDSGVGENLATSGRVPGDVGASGRVAGDVAASSDPGPASVSGITSTIGSDRARRHRANQQPNGSRRTVAWKIITVAILLAVVFGGAAFVLNRSSTPQRPRTVVQRQKHAATTLTETVTTPVTVTATTRARSEVRKYRPKSRRGSPRRLHKARPRTTIVDRTAEPIRPTPPPSDVVSTSSRLAGSSSKTQDSGSAESTHVTSSQSSGSGCAQSPDSGCLP